MARYGTKKRGKKRSSKSKGWVKRNGVWHKVGGGRRDASRSKSRKGGKHKHKSKARGRKGGAVHVHGYHVPAYTRKRPRR